MTLFRIRWSTPADLSALTDVFARASLSNEGDREALLVHPEALVLEGDGIAEGQTRVATNGDDIVGFATAVLEMVRSQPASSQGNACILRLHLSVHKKCKPAT